jgi:hypothetical protein
LSKADSEQQIPVILQNEHYNSKSKISLFEFQMETSRRVLVITHCTNSTIALSIAQILSTNACLHSQ